eukprot:UN10326
MNLYSRNVMTVHLGQLIMDEYDIQCVADYMQTIKIMIKDDIKKMKKTRKIIKRSADDVETKYEKLYVDDSDLT